MAGEKTKLLEMEATLARQVVGQPEALRVVSDAVRVSRAGLQAGERPLGVFRLVGPTGVGKTQLSKALAEFLFDSDAALTRLDMSEFSERHSVSRLDGAPPGYVGYDEGGQLTEARAAAAVLGAAPRRVREGTPRARATLLRRRRG